MDPHSFFADHYPAIFLYSDPDPAVFLNADPDPAFFLNAEPDPAVFSMRIRIQLKNEEFVVVEKTKNRLFKSEKIDQVQIYFKYFNKITIINNFLAPFVVIFQFKFSVNANPDVSGSTVLVGPITAKLAWWGDGPIRNYIKA